MAMLCHGSFLTFVFFYGYFKVLVGGSAILGGGGGGGGVNYRYFIVPEGTIGHFSPLFIISKIER